MLPERSAALPRCNSPPSRTALTGRTVADRGAGSSIKAHWRSMTAYQRRPDGTLAVTERYRRVTVNAAFHVAQLALNSACMTTGLAVDYRLSLSLSTRRSLAVLLDPQPSQLALHHDRLHSLPRVKCWTR